MTRKAGSVSAETKAAILSSAQEEFSEKGFQGASLRTIASNAGVTTGAIYCFFKGKDELFEAVLQTATEPFMDFLNRHYEYEISIIGTTRNRDKDIDYVISTNIINFYFKYRKTWDIIIRHMGHPVVQKFTDSFIDSSVNHYMAMVKILRNLDDEALESYRFAITQFVRIQSETTVSLFSAGFSKKEMTKHSITSIKMLRGAFHALLED